MNHMEKVAELLGVGLDEEFYTSCDGIIRKNLMGQFYISKFTERGFESNDANKYGMLHELILGNYQIVKVPKYVHEEVHNEKPCNEEINNKEACMQYVDYIRNNTDKRTLLEALAESSVKLSQASLHMIRTRYYSNTSPDDSYEIQKDMIKYFGDVVMVFRVLNFFHIRECIDIIFSSNKWKHWAKQRGYKGN